MSKHTPGPWQVVTDLDKLGENWAICWAGNWAIETTNLKADELGDELADAHLIGAAPRLLLVAQAAREALRHIDGQSIVIKLLLNDLDRVITEATGDTP